MVNSNKRLTSPLNTINLEPIKLTGYFDRKSTIGINNNATDSKPRRNIRGFLSGKLK